MVAEQVSEKTTMIPMELARRERDLALVQAEPAIRVRNLSVWYGTQQVLNEVSLEIFSNRITAIIGPSGCGKSTLIRCLNRMNDFIPSFRREGEIIFRGRDLHASNVDPIEVRLRIGMVFQKPNPFPKSIYENVAYGPRLLGVRKRNELDWVVEDSLRKAFLWEEVKGSLRKNALELSGGQQQRLCIARALAVEPEVLLLDEPCSAIDPIGTAKIEELLQKIKENYTVVIVTHNMQQAARASDFTGFLLSGRLVEFGETQDIFAKPKLKETEDYITGRFG